MIKLNQKESKQIDWIERLDIVSVFEKLGVSLKKSGSKYYSLCPLHNDKETPSLVVYPFSNSWTCFSPNCVNPKHPGKQNGGGPIDFVMQYNNLSFFQTIEWFEKEFGFFNDKNDSKIESVELNNKQEKVKLNFVENSQLLYWQSLMELTGERSFFHKRGFEDYFIDNQLWGFDGQAHIITIWEDEPINSTCLAVKRRPKVKGSGPKYIKMGGEAHFWGLYYGQVAIILCFAGELDAARAVQDGLPAVSLVNGANGFKKLPKEWPDIYFPYVEKLIVCFDRGEESAAGKMSEQWENIKGKFTSSILHYPFNFEGKDYCDWRDKDLSVDEFLKLIL